MRIRRALALFAAAGALLAGAVVPAAASGSDDSAARQQQDGTAEPLAFWWPQNSYPPLETNVGKKVSKPDIDASNCWALPYKATACYKSHGDYIYVSDMKSDGRSAIAAFEDMTSENVMYRQGVCRNPYGKGTWVRCNYEFRESHWGIWISAGTSNGWAITDLFSEFMWTKP